MKRVTAEWLESLNACPEQVENFRAEWPKGATVTLANLRRAEEIGLNTDWLTCNLPQPALAVYLCAEQDARDVYLRAEQDALIAALKSIKENGAGK